MKRPRPDASNAISQVSRTVPHGSRAGPAAGLGPASRPRALPTPFPAAWALRRPWDPAPAAEAVAAEAAEHASAGLPSRLGLRLPAGRQRLLRGCVQAFCECRQGLSACASRRGMGLQVSSLLRPDSGCFQATTSDTVSLRALQFQQEPQAAAPSTSLPVTLPFQPCFRLEAADRPFR